MASHKRIELSHWLPPVIRVLPSALKATADTCFNSFSKARSFLPVARSQTERCWAAPTASSASSVLPSDEKASGVTSRGPVWSVWTSLPVLTFQRVIVPLELPIARRSPLGESTSDQVDASFSFCW